jgi:ABC-type uncharacterized transport system permease subunit
MIYTDPTTGATTSTDASPNFLNKLTPNTFLVILAVIVIIALLIIFIQSSSGNNSSSPSGANPNMAYTNPLNATMRANPFINTPQRTML